MAQGAALAINSGKHISKPTKEAEAPKHSDILLSLGLINGKVKGVILVMKSVDVRTSVLDGASVFDSAFLRLKEKVNSQAELDAKAFGANAIGNITYEIGFCGQTERTTYLNLIMRGSAVLQAS